MGPFRDKGGGGGHRQGQKTTQVPREIVTLGPGGEQDQGGEHDQGPKSKILEPRGMIARDHYQGTKGDH